MFRSALITFLTVASVLAHLEDLSAAPSNGTRLPPSRQVELGYEYNYMFKRPLDRSFGDLSTQDHFYTVSFGAFDWLSLDGKIGLGDMTEKNGSQLPELEFNTGFAGGYGFRVKPFEKKDWGLRAILGFQHICVHPAVRSVDDDKYSSILDDWQVSGIIAKDYKVITAYVGMKGSDCEIIYKINKHNRKRRFSDEHIGLISGLELYLFDRKARVSVEGRFFDETALTTSASYLF